MAAKTEEVEEQPNGSNLIQDHAVCRGWRRRSHDTHGNGGNNDACSVRYILWANELDVLMPVMLANVGRSHL